MSSALLDPLQLPVAGQITIAVKFSAEQSAGFRALALIAELRLARRDPGTVLLAATAIPTLTITKINKPRRI
jgi:hypothetical protein